MADNNIDKAYTEFVKSLTDEQRAKLETALSEYKAKQDQPKPKKRTGYERVEKNGVYYYPISSQYAGSTLETKHFFDDDRYEIAAYYSDKTVAENNIRADILLRQLRRFAVEHRNNELDWENKQTKKYMIAYNYINKGFYVNETMGESIWNAIRVFGTICFDSKETARLAIVTFKDELIWYFTEYKDSL